MAGFTIELKGLDQTLKRLDTVKFKQDVQDELNAFGVDVVTDAKLLAPVDEGLLKNLISTVIGQLSVTIIATAEYSAYLEFGTRRFAEVYVSALPETWQVFASQFKGAGGGTFEELVFNLVRWCKAKGIEEKAAYPIALKILREGIIPHSFLYPAFEKNRLLLIERLKTLL